MRHTTQWISNNLKGLLILAGLFLFSCSHAPSRDEGAAQVLQQKIFYFPYESVWRAAQLSLKYPIYINNMDTGILETEFIKSIDGYVPPYAQQNPPGGIRYKITLNVAKGKVGSKPSTRVTITKTMEKQRDFFSDPEALQSDGLEEKILFYRIERELLIDEALKKNANKGSSKEEEFE